MKKVFKMIAMLSILTFAFCFTACGAQEDTESSTSETSESKNESTQAQAETVQLEEGIAADTVTGDSGQSKILVAYFSATGNTKSIAETIANLTGADIFEIVPAEPYTDEDLNYNNNECRANKEQNDSKARPEISGSVENMDQYNIVLIGHPIWWGEEPRIIDTFMESYDLSGKTVVNFCTSGGSGISTAADNLKALSPNAVWLEGHRFETGAGEERIQAWLDSLNLTDGRESNAGNVMYIRIGEQTLSVEMADNTSAEALLTLLQGGDITVNASDYGGFEKVGALGSDLPANDEQITTEPGDVILYQGNQVTLYYDTNTWNFTRLGKVVGMTQDELKEILGDGDVTMILSLKN